MKVVLDIIYVEGADFIVLRNKVIAINAGTGQLVTVIRNHIIKWLLVEKSNRLMNCLFSLKDSFASLIIRLGRSPV